MPADETPTGFGAAPLRICTDCTPRHYENCEACYGFGVYADGLPITAAESDNDPPDARPCPTCHSTTNGVPADAR